MAQPFIADHVQWDGPLVIGAGLAGLSAALSAADAGRRVLVAAAAPLGEGCASAWAQGGVAVALSPDDSPSLHAADTIAAGAGLVDAAAAALLTDAGPDAVRRLAALGAPFDRDAEGRFVQSLEAAHSRPRVARVGGDGAGRAVMNALILAVRGSFAVEVKEGWEARALTADPEGRIVGALLEREGVLTEVSAPVVILATGGVGGLYTVTTNPKSARGVGLALAAAAGALVSDPEFVQFHPTAIDIGRDPAPLATEALRGEGAVLVDRTGAPFMARYDARGDLAPRDVVARAIARQRAEDRGAFLDARAAVGAHFPQAFPAVFAACMHAGIDPRRAPIPVAPAAHYHMGGIKTDGIGRTSLEGLYAVGECASTGVHGANRLASNSLLEAAVFGARAGAAAAAACAPSRPGRGVVPPRLPAAPLMELRRAMDRYVGVVRTGEGLKKILDRLAALEAAFGPAPEIQAATLIAGAALRREESRGGHFRLDFPSSLSAPKRTETTLLAMRESLNLARALEAAAS